MAEQESGAAVSKKGGAKVWLPPPLVYLGFLAVGLILHWQLPLPMAFPRAPANVAGAVVALAGVYLLVHAVILFRRSGQNPAPWLPSPEMILAGPYRFTRNPMYLAMTLIVLGIGIGLAEGWVVFGALLAAVVVHETAILPEEAYLTEKFGDAYLQFKAKVRRWI